MKIIFHLFFLSTLSLTANSQCLENQMVYDFDANITPWQGINTYQFGQSNTDIDNDPIAKSLHAKLSFNQTNQSPRAGAFSNFNNSNQNWANYQGLEFNFIFVSDVASPPLSGNPPYRPDGTRQIYLELVDQSGNVLTHYFTDSTNAWYHKKVYWSEFTGDSNFNRSAITSIAVYSDRNGQQYTEVFRIDNIELICECDQDYTVYNFDNSISPWQALNTYQFGQSNTDIGGDPNDGLKSIFVKLNFDNLNQEPRAGAFSNFNGTAQNWSLYTGMRWDFVYVDFQYDSTTNGRPPARSTGEREAYIELQDILGNIVTYSFTDVNTSWQERTADWSEFTGASNFNFAAIASIGYYVDNSGPDFTEVYRFDDIELICDPNNIVVPQQGLLCDVAQVFNFPQGSPKYSDVCLTSRRRRPDAAGNYPFTTESAIENFHPTRLDWTVVTDSSYINEVIVPYSIAFSGVLNSKLPDVVGGNVNNNGRCLEKNTLQPIEWPWLDTPNNYDQFVASANDPAYKNIYLDHARKYYEGQGRDNLVAIHMDEPGFAYRLALRFDGCFGPSDTSKANLLQYNIDDPIVNQEFQKLSQTQFYTDMHNAIIAETGNQNLGFSYNNGNKDFTRGGFDFSDDRSSQSFDFAMGELDVVDLDAKVLYNTSKMAKQDGKIQVYSPARFVRQSDTDPDYEGNPSLYRYQTTPEEVGLNRKAIATSYATGSIHFVPWDTWFYRQTRHFGDPSEYADLFGMIRALPFYFDNYEDAAVYAPDNSLTENRYNGDSPVSVNSANNDVWAFARAIPDNKLAPIVVHLVNWGNNTNASVSIINKYISPNETFTASLLTPKPYNQSEHALATQNAENILNGLRGDYQYTAYQPLVESESVTINQGDQTSTISLSNLGTWSILVLIPDGSCEENLVELNQPIINNDRLLNSSIISNGNVATGNQVTYKAGSELEFSSGFRVQSGANFLADIGNCEQIDSSQGNLLTLEFNNSLLGVEGESPNSQIGISYNSGILGLGIVVDDQAELSYESDSNINHSAGTIEAIVKSNWSGNDNVNHALFSWGQAGGMLIEKDVNGYFKVIINRYGHDGSGSEILAEYGINNNWQANEWKHVAITWTSTVVKLYIDGEEKKAAISNYSLPQIGADNIFVGSDNLSKTWDGVIDEFYISDFAKTSFEIRNFYDSLELN